MHELKPDLNKFLGAKTEGRSLELDSAIGGIPRFRFGALPTPLEKGPLLPSGRRLWIKRDDLTAMGLGGNKVRKLEFIAGDALSKGATTLLTCGASQSNHCRVSAAVASYCNLKSHLFLWGNEFQSKEEGSPLLGNQALIQLYGGEIHYVKGGPNEASSEMNEYANYLKSHGENPYVIEAGGSNHIGALGFAFAFSELMNQLSQKNIKASAIYLASSTRGTQAGLGVGRAMLRESGLKSGYSMRAIPKIIGVDVNPLDRDSQLAREMANKRVREIGEGTLKLVGRFRENMLADHIETVEPFVADGAFTPYGEVHESSDDVLIWAARNLGLVLDRIYSSKALFTLLQNNLKGNLENGEGSEDVPQKEDGDVIFWNSGGHPSLFSDQGFPPMMERL